jgi:hypothetical protein
VLEGSSAASLVLVTFTSIESRLGPTWDAFEAVAHAFSTSTFVNILCRKPGSLTCFAVVLACVASVTLYRLSSSELRTSEVELLS